MRFIQRVCITQSQAHYISTYVVLFCTGAFCIIPELFHPEYGKKSLEMCSNSVHIIQSNARAQSKRTNVVSVAGERIARICFHAGSEWIRLGQEWNGNLISVWEYSNQLLATIAFITWITKPFSGPALDYAAIIYFILHRLQTCMIIRSNFLHRCPINSDGEMVWSYAPFWKIPFDSHKCRMWLE